MTSVTTEPRRSLPGLPQLQRIGRSLMLPIAALPAAALLLRLGQDDLLGKVHALKNVAAVIGAAGGALFDNLYRSFHEGLPAACARKRS